MDPALSTTTAPRTLNAYGGWALARAVVLDAAAPGFLAASCGWGPARRQTAFLVLAVLAGGETDLGGTELGRRLGAALTEGDSIPGDTPAGTRAVIGRALLALRPPRVLRAALGGPVPAGLAGALARLGPDPADDPTAYAAIAALFASHDPVDRARVRVIGQHPGRITVGQIRALARLEPALVHRAVLAHLRQSEDARTLGDAVAYLRRHCGAATDRALRESLDALPQGQRLQKWLRRWSNRFDSAPGLVALAEAIAAQPELRLLDSGAALTDAGRRYDNCLASKVTEVLAGRHAYVEYRSADPDTPGAIAELRRCTRGYVLEATYLKGNRWRASPSRGAVREALRRAGVVIKGRASGGADERAALSQWLDIHAWDRDEAGCEEGDELAGLAGELDEGLLDDELGAAA